MPRGRPRILIAPCGYCGKQFKRQEHLLRHERIHTHEKPFVCNCGQGFSRQDLLSRHARISHPSPSSLSLDFRVQSCHSEPSEREQPPMICDTVNQGINDLDFELTWDPDFMAEHVLPASIFDTYFPSVSTSDLAQARSTQPRRTSFTRFSSHLPVLEDTEDFESDAGDGRLPEAVAVPWYITESGYEKLCIDAKSYWEIVPAGCSVPSRNKLIRYLEKYLTCIADFVPFVHTATFSAEHNDIDFLLAMSSLGSLYLFEYTKSYELYFMAKAILMERIRREELLSTCNFLSGHEPSLLSARSDLGRIQTFILLVSFASWADKTIVPDAFSMGSQLATLMRANGISESDEMQQVLDWSSWIAVEERRRTLFAAYALFSLHNIAFDTPPLILNHEIAICLPGHEEQWKSKTMFEWRQSTRPVERQFQQGLRSLFDGSPSLGDTKLSSFSNYLLIHGLLQQIYADRHGFTRSMQSNTIKSFDTALRTWQISWGLTNDSTLEPLSSKGPFGFLGTVLLRIAYIRLSSDVNSSRGLFSRDLTVIAALRPHPARISTIDKAVLHAAHALSIPVRHGIDFVARTKTPIWSIEHSLCSLESALLLSDWLRMISTTVRTSGFDRLRKVETKILAIIDGIIKETSFAQSLDNPEDDASRTQRMATTVVKLWAQMFQGAHLLDIDNHIGASLQILGDTSPS